MWSMYMDWSISVILKMFSTEQFHLYTVLYPIFPFSQMICSSNIVCTNCSPKPCSSNNASFPPCRVHTQFDTFSHSATLLLQQLRYSMLQHSLLGNRRYDFALCATYRFGIGDGILALNRAGSLIGSLVQHTLFKTGIIN